MNNPQTDALRIRVNAYDERHPEHEALVNLECDKGLDIALLPSFEIEIINGIPIHPTKRIGNRGGSPENLYVTDEQCIESAAIDVHLASYAAVADVEAGEGVFLANLGGDSPLAAYISAVEYEESFLVDREPKMEGKRDVYKAIN